MIFQKIENPYLIQDGMGALKIDDDRIRVIGEAQFDRPVHFSELSTAEVRASLLKFSSILMHIAFCLEFLRVLRVMQIYTASLGEQ